MDEDRTSQPPFGTPPDEAFHPNDNRAGLGSDGDYAPGLSRKVLFGIMGVIAVIFAFGSAWVGYQYASTSAIAKLGSSVSTPAIPAAATPAAPPPDTAAPVPPSASVPVEPAGGVAAGPSAPPTLPSAEELLGERKGKDAPLPAPAALVRDLPDWLVTEVGGRRTEKAPTKAVAVSTPDARMPDARMPDARMPESSGASGDESAASQGKPAPRGERQERAAAVFARCPKPGESGAVECRRAVCSGAARKQGACAAYLN